MIRISSSYLARSIAPVFLASDVLTMPSNFAKGLGSDTAGLLGGTGGPFLRPPLTLTWKLLVIRLMVELTLLLPLVLPLTELSVLLELEPLGRLLWDDPPRGTIVADALEDICRMRKKKLISRKKNVRQKNSLTFTLTELRGLAED